MREIRTSGLVGGAAQLNAPSLPQSARARLLVVAALYERRFFLLSRRL